MASALPLDAGRMAQMQIDDRSFRRIAAIVQGEFGIKLGDNKRCLVVSRLSRRLRELNLADFAAYCRYLDCPAGDEERRQMRSLLTTNVTRFFREPHHFRALTETVLPPLIARARVGGRVRLWSAGCASGEEPYSIALSVLDLCPEAARRDIRILGTDIDPQVIHLGRTASYDLRQAPIPRALLAAHFTAEGSTPGRYRVNEDLRKLVTLAELNLMEDWPMRGRFDVIFCRNVAIYFDAGTQERLWARLSAALAPGGHLFVGHSERVTGPAADRLLSVGLTQYRLARPAPGNDRKGEIG